MPMMVMGSATITMPVTIAIADTILPLVVIGTKSPYPTAVSVTMQNQNEAGMLLNGERSPSDR